MHFTGRVQGVGFRYTATRCAKDHVVAGYVMNLPDGRVQLVAEGEKAELDGLVKAILARMPRNITRHTIDETPGNGEFGEPMPGGLTIRR